MAKATLLTFTLKRQTVSGKRGENMVTWSLLPFAVNAMLNLSNLSNTRRIYEKDRVQEVYWRSFNLLI